MKDIKPTTLIYDVTSIGNKQGLPGPDYQITSKIVEGKVDLRGTVARVTTLPTKR